MDQYIEYLQIFVREFSQIYFYIIVVRVILTWFPGKSNALFDFVEDVVDPYLDVFKKFIPNIGMIDISPIVAIFALQYLARFTILLLEYIKQFV